MKTSIYLVVRPEHNYRGEVISIDVDRLTKTAPKLRAAEIAVKLNLSIEKNVFEQFLPEISIHLDDPRQFVTPQVDIEPPVRPEPEGDEEDELRPPGADGEPLPGE